MLCPVTKSSTRHLSEVARHVIVPSGIVSTGWPAVRDRLAQFSIPFDVWQQDGGKLILAKRENGMYAAGVGGVVLSIPRQVGKTYMIGWIIFALCTIFSGLTVIWTAHHTRTSNETFMKMRAMATKAKVRPYVATVRATNGEQAVIFTNGSRILFGARDQGFGLGFDQVDVLVLDEAQRVKEVAMADMVPATNAAPNGLVIMMGTPPRPTDTGDVFLNRRTEALNGDTDTLYIELSADRDARIIDWAQVAKANPSYPHRTSREAILRMQKLLADDDNFRREAYGVWDELTTTRAHFNLDHWQALKVPTAPQSGRKCYAVRFTPDGSLVALAAAIRPDDGGPIFTESRGARSVADGLGWLIDFLVERAPMAAQIVIEGKGGVGFLVNALRDRGVRNKHLLIVPSEQQAVAAYSLMEHKMLAGDIRTFDQPEVDEELKVLVKRPIGKQGGFGWQGIDDVPVAQFEAMTLATWAAATTRRNPGKTGTGVVVL